MELPADSKEFVALLVAHGVDFVVVGGHAVAFHGHPRFTRDMDLLVRPTIENGERILAALKAFGFGDLRVSPESFVDQDLVIQLGRAPNRIDLLTGLSGVDFDEAWSSRVEATIHGVRVFILGRDALLKNKRATGRPQDLVDAERIEARSRKDPQPPP